MRPCGSSPWPISRAREQFVDYLKEGVLHIWIGFDHILFLLALLLPAVLVRSQVRGERWAGAPSFGFAFWDVFRVVTAFTSRIRSRCRWRRSAS